VALYPFHRDAPQFSMRVIETFTKGGFPKLVLASKREFASKYGLQGEYWRHFKPEDSPQVLAYVKTNLKDLATHYHAQYQSAQEASEKLANYNEARRWYGDYLDSFPKDADSPTINYRLADLLLENHDFGEAAKQYERTAYGYPPNPRSAGAGYAAVYAYREQLKGTSPAQLDVVKRNTIASSLRFADAFPQHEHAAEVLGAAADDMYEMKDYRPAVEYDAGAALIRLRDWTAAVNVLDAFRNSFPDHKLRLEADKQIAHAYRENGQLANAAVEYDHIASKSDDPALRSEALLVAGDL